MLWKVPSLREYQVHLAVRAWALIGGPSIKWMLFCSVFGYVTSHQPFTLHPPPKKKNTPTKKLPILTTWCLLIRRYADCSFDVMLTCYNGIEPWRLPHRSKRAVLGFCSSCAVRDASASVTFIINYCCVMVTFELLLYIDFQETRGDGHC